MLTRDVVARGLFDHQGALRNCLVGLEASPAHIDAAPLHVTALVHTERVLCFVLVEKGRREGARADKEQAGVCLPHFHSDEAE